MLYSMVGSYDSITFLYARQNIFYSRAKNRRSAGRRLLVARALCGLQMNVAPHRQRLFVYLHVEILQGFVGKRRRLVFEKFFHRFPLNNFFFFLKSQIFAFVKLLGDSGNFLEAVVEIGRNNCVDQRWHIQAIKQRKYPQSTALVARGYGGGCGGGCGGGWGGHCLRVLSAYWVQTFTFWALPLQLTTLSSKCFLKKTHAPHSV